MDAENLEHRKLLISTQHQLNDNYDKLVVTLSGGALALSITFLKDIVTLTEANYVVLLVMSWALFIISLAAILGEILFGIEAYKKAVDQLDDSTIMTEKVGGWYSEWVKWFGRIAAICLLLGLLSLSIFVYLNVGKNDEPRKEQATSEAHSTTSKTAPPNALSTNTKAGSHRRLSSEKKLGTAKTTP